MSKNGKKTARKRTKPTRSSAVPDVSHVLRGGMPRTLGVRITSVTRKKVVGEMAITETHMNVNGRVNGGAIMSFGDVLGAAGAVANRLPGYRGGTIESKTNFFAGGKGPKLSGVSVALHVGRTTSVWQTTIKNADGRMVAIVTQTQISVPAGNAEKD
jgi:1,4-dihydroxy-2-naphthoyl-CoA hydrolase